MRYKPFGATDLMVSEIGLGGAQLGGYFPDVTMTDMLRTVQSAQAAGITFFDTADMYWAGRSEQLLGRAFRNCRNEVVIATKAGYLYNEQPELIARAKSFVRPLIEHAGIRRPHRSLGSAGGPPPQDFSSEYIRRAAEHSLKRLGTHYLDLFQLHSPPTAILESGDFLAPLEALKRDGKVRYFGVSCETTQDALICLRYPTISSLQIRINLLDQSALTELVTSARERNVALIARECFATGLLSHPIEVLDLESIIPDSEKREAKRDQLLQTADMARRSGRSLPETALQFVLGIKDITVTLVGMRTEAHLRDTMHMAAAPALSDHEHQSLQA